MNIASEVLGYKGTDRITGFSGIITGHCEYLTGCTQLLLLPQAAPDGSLRSAEWFDIQRIEIGVEAPMLLDNSRVKGADKPAPKR